MPDPLLQRMNGLFQADFSDVRICLGAEPECFDTLAFTHGNHIFLLPEVFHPERAWSREILAHELTHVLQQQQELRGLDMSDEVELEAEAIRAGRSVMHDVRPVLRFASRSGVSQPTDRRLVQTYTVVASPGFAGHAPAITINNPSFHAAAPAIGAAPDYANDSFIVQLKNGPNAQSARSFLRVGGAINYQSYAANDVALSLRLSQNQNIAIQDAGLNTIQPKVFYATPQIVAESNLRLNLLEANIRLYMVDNHRTITIGAKTLRRVMPINRANNSRGLDFLCGQNCDNMIQQVMGIGTGFLEPKDIPGNVGAGLWEYDIARDINVLFGDPVTDVDNATNITRATTMRTIATQYAGHYVANNQHLNFSNFRVNKYALPELGEGFVISTLIATPLVAPGGAVVAGVGPAGPGRTLEDHTAAAPQTLDSRLTWGSHWGGIVARDGNDVVTLENYARNREDAVGGADNRYYFQMYNRALTALAAETWHGHWSTTAMIAYGAGLAGLAVPPPGGWAPFPLPSHRPASPGARSAANGITVAVRIPDNQWSTLAQHRYNGQVENIKNDHNLVAPSTSAHAEIKEVLKGLYYADDHLVYNPRGARATRVTAWKDALRNPPVAGRYPENRDAIAYTLAQLGML